VPKAKPTDVSVLRIELQEKEREMLDTFLTTWQVGKAATAVDQLLSLENAYLAVTIYEMVSGKEVLPGTPNDIYTLIDWVRTYVKENQEEVYAEAGTGTNVLFSILQDSTVLGQVGGFDWLDRFRDDLGDG
tara:strand:+ start:261 stop:653 length:393 start_codon:yes stop_codon:yes gene_type:complete